MEKKLKAFEADKAKKIKELYEKSIALFNLRAQEANKIGEINNILSSKKNIKGNVDKLRNQITKQKELLYNVDFQIQLMERKIAWVQGKRSKEETDEINREKDDINMKITDKEEKLKEVKVSIKSIEEKLRIIENDVTYSHEDSEKLTKTIEALELEITNSNTDLLGIVKRKEDTLVQHDLMKLEIKKLFDKLVREANSVYTEENSLSQLQIGINEREKEIQVHKEVLVSENKVAEEERHKAAKELAVKIKKRNNMKLKYESIIQKNKKSEDGAVNDEHSQAYYIIKTAQEKEELSRMSILIKRR